MPRVLNKKWQPTLNAIYIGRPSIWGNPFKIGRDGTREEVIEKYRRWIANQPALLARLHELKGHDLICYCAPLPCHGEVLLALANASQNPKGNSK